MVATPPHPKSLINIYRKKIDGWRTIYYNIVWVWANIWWDHRPRNGKAVWVLVVRLDSLLDVESSEYAQGEKDTSLRWKVEVQTLKRSSRQGSSLEGHGGPHEIGIGCCKRMFRPTEKERRKKQKCYKVNWIFSTALTVHRVQSQRVRVCIY